MICDRSECKNSWPANNLRARKSRFRGSFRKLSSKSRYILSSPRFFLQMLGSGWVIFVLQDLILPGRLRCF